MKFILLILKCLGCRPRSFETQTQAEDASLPAKHEAAGTHLDILNSICQYEAKQKQILNKTPYARACTSRMRPYHFTRPPKVGQHHVIVVTNTNRYQNVASRTETSSPPHKQLIL